jgi:hypothetical protein
MKGRLAEEMRGKPDQWKSIPALFETMTSLRYICMCHPAPKNSKCKCLELIENLNIVTIQKSAIQYQNHSIFEQIFESWTSLVYG